MKTYFEVNRPEEINPENSRSPVVLVHGLAASLYDWIELMPALCDAGYASYALDLLGHGKSEKPLNADDYNIDNVFLAFSNWIDTLQLDRPFVLVGHSLGGYLSIRYTLQYPERIRALILCDPFYSPDQLPPLLRLSYRYSLINTTLIARTPEWMIRSIVDLTSLSIRNGFVLPESVRKQTAEDYKRARPEIFNIINSIRDLSSSFFLIDQPSLIIWGSKDVTLDFSSLSRIAQQMPNAIGIEIEGAGHVPHQSHPRVFNRHVQDFLNNLP